MVKTASSSGRRSLNGGGGRGSWLAGCMMAMLASVSHSSLLFAEPPAVSFETIQPSEEEIRTLIKQLADPSYHRRQVAMRRLKSVGAVAIEPLEQAMRSGNLEIVDRASLILQSLAALETPKDPPVAWDALTRLKSSGPGSAATRADSSMGTIRTERGVRAHARLAAAGLPVGYHELTIASRPVAVNAIIFPNRWKMDEEALAWVPWMYGVTTVVLEGDAVNDATIDAIVKLPSLHDIQIRDASLSTRNLRKLAEIDRIDILEMLFVDVGGPDEDLFALTELDIRKSLLLTATKFTAEDVRALAGELEGVEIVHSEGGFLGVQCNQFDNACIVRLVVPGSAADRAGIRIDDVIVQLGEHPITKFADLQEFVRKYSPTTSMEMKFERAGVSKTVTVELGRL